MSNATHTVPVPDRVSLVDGLYEHAAASECKLLVIVAGASIPTSAVVDHAAAAFIAERVKC